MRMIAADKSIKERKLVEFKIKKKKKRNEKSRRRNRRKTKQMSIYGVEKNNECLICLLESNRYQGSNIASYKDTPVFIRTVQLIQDWKLSNNFEKSRFPLHDLNLMCNLYTVEGKIMEINPTLLELQEK